MKYLLDNLAEIHEGMSASPEIFVGLDYDGTLSPIAETPDKAVLAPDMRRAVEAFAADGRYRKAIVTGRSLASVKRMVDVPGFAYIGNHGFEIEAPEVSGTFADNGWMERLEEACIRLEQALARVEGAYVERKGPTASVHFRRVEESETGRVERVFRDVMGGFGDIRVTHGKKVFELRPSVEMNKGKAVASYLSALFGRDWEGRVFLMYAGDDSTDEDVFRIIGGNGAGIRVLDSSLPGGPTAAAYSLRDTEEVRRFLEWLVAR